MSARAAIAGVGATPYYFRGESEPQTHYELMCKAILAACADAGLTLRDIDGLVGYSTAFEPGLITQSLGIPELRFSANVAAQGGGSAGVLDLAAMAVAWVVLIPLAFSLARLADRTSDTQTE